MDEKTLTQEELEEIKDLLDELEKYVSVRLPFKDTFGIRSWADCDNVKSLCEKLMGFSPDLIISGSTPEHPIFVSTVYDYVNKHPPSTRKRTIY